MGKGGRCVGLTTLPPSCADYHEIWEPQPSGNISVFPGIALHLLFSLLACMVIETILELINKQTIEFSFTRIVFTVNRQDADGRPLRVLFSHDTASKHN